MIRRFGLILTPRAGAAAARGSLIAHFDDDDYSAPGRLVFNRTVTLKDSWIKEQS